tara:strand:- start:91 stop:288 length:198 start_codon:yes stop_codon:yes gene_type:complete
LFSTQLIGADKMKKHILDLMIVSDYNYLLKDKKQSKADYEKEQWKAYKRLSKILMSIKKESRVLA